MRNFKKCFRKKSFFRVFQTRKLREIVRYNLFKLNMEHSCLSESSVNESESCDDFVLSVQTFLEQGKVESVLSLFGDKKYEFAVQNTSWDLIPIVTKYLTSEAKENKLKEYAYCQKLITVIAKRSNPEEVLLQLIEEIEECSDDTKFFNLLKPMRRVVERIPSKRVNSFAWCFNAIQSYIQKLPLPTDLDLSGEEKLLLDCDINFNRITLVYLDVIPFYEHFVTAITTKQKFQGECKDVVCKFLIQLLDKPLAYLDMDDSVKMIGRARRLADNIITLIVKLIPDPFIFLDFEKTKNNDFSTPQSLSLSILYYLLLCSQTPHQSIPRLYNPVYLFQYTLKFVTLLLREEHQLCLEKAFSLITKTLELVAGINLPYLLLDSSDHCYFCKALTNIIVYHQAKEIREQAFENFQTYLHAFELKGQYLLIYNLMGILNHTGLIGFVITTYKEMLASELSKNEKDMSIYFKGEKMWNVLSKFCYLPLKEESDLLELSDQIISCLNLLRFLVLRDKNNVTEFKVYIPILEQKYLEPLKKGILLSHSHYELKLKDLLEEEHSAGVQKNNMDSRVSLIACGQNLPELPFLEKKTVIQSSLTAFDVMDSLLCRLNECIANL